MTSIPDATTVEFFRERLRKTGVIEELFDRFEEHLGDQVLEALGGQIIDATLAPIPKQRNTRGENKAINQGKLPQTWEDKANRMHQKDFDARWMKKNGISHYGSKNSICIDNSWLHPPLHTPPGQHPRHSDAYSRSRSREQR